MKHFLSLVIVLLFITNGFSQKNTSNNYSKIGVSYSSFGSNPVVFFQTLAGAPSYNSNHFYTLSLDYSFSIMNNLEIETSFDYSEQTVTVVPNVSPEINMNSHNQTFTILSIPVGVKYSFLKYVFINGGAFISYDNHNKYEVDNQSGIGLYGGLGLEYTLNMGLSVFINPYLKAHSLIPFDTQGTQAHLMESGFKMGVKYKL